MMVIVVSGGIGSGKSEFCRLLGEKLPSALVYNADERAKLLYTPDFLSRIERDFGTSLRDSRGCFVKERLSELIFTDSDKLRHLESILFPLMESDFKSFSAGARFAVFESATVLEKPYFNKFGDRIVLVDAPLRTRLMRACKRDNVSQEMVMRRIEAQPLMNTFSEALENGTFRSLPQADRIDAIISNTGDFDFLEEQTDKFIENIMKTNLAKILSVSGHGGLFLYIAQSRSGAIVEALSDKKRTCFGGNSKITTLADIAIYTDDGEMKLKDVFLALNAKLGDKPAPSSKESPEAIKALFAEAIPNYDGSRFYVSHMKKVVDWYNCLREFASFDFEEENQEEALVEE